MLLHPRLETVFHALEYGGIRWCLLWGEAEPGAPASEIDLLVDHADVPRVEHMLETLEFVRVPTWGRGARTSFVSYDLPTDHWIKLDIETELSYGPRFALRTWAEAGCLARRRRDGVVVALAPDDAFWTLLLHCILDKGTVAPQQATRLQDLAGSARTDGPLARTVEAACPDGWNAARVVECVRSGDWAVLQQLASPLAVRWTRRHPISVGSRMLVKPLVGLIERGLTPLRRRGVSVTLLGPDGTGKSTLAAGIGDSFYFPARSVYMGLWQQPSARGFRQRLPGADLTTRLLRLWWRYLIAQYHQAWGRLVIFDRYTYDALLAPSQHSTWRRRLYHWLLGHACPTPDVVLLLDAPGDVMYERKGEYPAEHLEAERQRFLALQPRIPRLEVVDATRAADAVRADVVNRIWQRYHARWRRK